MIQKLVYETHRDGNGNVYGSIPSDAEIIDKINEVIDCINSLSEEKLSEEDALLLERAWLTLDGFGHEELAERLRKLKEKIC